MSARRAASPALVLAFLLAAVSTFAACGGDPGADITYRVSAPEGTPMTDALLTQTVTELDLRLAEAGFKSRSVAPLGRDKILVVLPERVAHRRQEIRTILENPDGLRVELEVIGNPAD